MLLNLWENIAFAMVLPFVSKNAFYVFLMSYKTRKDRLLNSAIPFSMFLTKILAIVHFHSKFQERSLQSRKSLIGGVIVQNMLELARLRMNNVLL
jgi:hypothetical protein